MNFKSKFPRELLNEVKWKNFDLNECEIYYINRGSPGDVDIVRGGQIIKVDKAFLILEGIPDERYIPYHRIIKIKYKDEIIFEKMGNKVAEN